MMDKVAKVALGAALLVSVASVLFVLTQQRTATDAPDPTSLLDSDTTTNGVGEIHATPLFRESFATIFAPDPTAKAATKPKPENGVAEKFRLVTVSLASDPNLSMAFIENKTAKTQKCYHPGDDLEDGYTVSEITDKGAVVNTPTGPFLLTFGTAFLLGGSNSTASNADGVGDSGALLHKFGGRRSGTNEWHFSRSAVMDYYEELKSRPERLVTVFDTMAPVYDANEHIEGYKVDIKGEAEFFKAIGFNQGDIVREVNGIPMTNRRAAENLIRRYADDDLDFIVIQMERDGKSIQQVYHSFK
jgi:type II secretory pathway component PulC